MIRKGLRKVREVWPNHLVDRHKVTAMDFLFYAGVPDLRCRDWTRRKGLTDHVDTTGTAAKTGTSATANESNKPAT